MEKTRAIDPICILLLLNFFLEKVFVTAILASR